MTHQPPPDPFALRDLTMAGLGLAWLAVAVGYAVARRWWRR